MNFHPHAWKGMGWCVSICIAHSFLWLAQVLLIKATLDVGPTQSKIKLNNYVRLKGFQLGQLTLDTGDRRSEMKLLLVCTNLYWWEQREGRRITVDQVPPHQFASFWDQYCFQSNV